MKKPVYINGNARDIKKIFGTNNFGKPQLIITSPPYFDVLNYENNQEQMGYGQESYEDYLNDIVNVFQDCYELASDNATFWLVVDTYRRDGEVKPLPFDINYKLKERFKETWILKEVIVWDKDKNVPWNGKGRLKNEFEYVLFFAKNKDFIFNIDRVREINDLKKWWLTYPERYNPQGKAPSNVWQFTTPIRGWGLSYQNHFCPFPFPLVEKILSIASDECDLVCDPFVGSGSVLAIAAVMNRCSVGIDINEKYKKLFEDEVMIGGERYWKNRSKELSQNKGAINNFKETNQRLRKLKVANHICHHLNSLNQNHFLYFLLDNEENDSPNLYVLENGSKPKINLESEKIEHLLRQAKVKPNLIIVDEDEFIKKHKKMKLFKYKLNKFYSYSTTTSPKSIKISGDRYDYIYSNIEVKIR